MSTDNRAEAARALEQAWFELSQGRRKPARESAQRAAQLDPKLEGPWFVLAALGTPEESVGYLQKVLEINPNNPRAQKGLQWAMERIQAREEILASTPETDRVRAAVAPRWGVDADKARAAAFNDLERDLIGKGCDETRVDETRPVQVFASPPAPMAAPVQPLPRKKEHTQPVVVKADDKPASEKAPQKVKPTPSKSAPRISRARVAAFMVLGMVGCLILSVALTIPFSGVLFPSFAASGTSQEMVQSIPGFSLIADLAGFTPTPEPAQPRNGEGDDSEGGFIVTTPTSVTTATYAPTFTPPATATPYQTSTPVPTNTPTGTETEPPIVEAIPVTPKPEQAQSQASDEDFTGRWIDVDLANQKAYAMEDDAVVREFTISSGIASHPTVTGQFHIYLKYRYDDMVGPGYNLKDVPFVMYFYKGYGLHGTYWHNNFGHPMSHGCVNMRTDEAEWLYNFAPMGTLVNIH